MRRQAGFSLLEVLLATCVLVLALLPIVNLTIENTRKTRFNRERSLAFLLATQVLERYRGEPFAALKGGLADASAGASKIEADALLTPPASDAPPGYLALVAPFDRSVVFEPEPSEPRKGRLRAVVKWQRDQAEPGSVELSTVVVDRNFPVGR
jgi:type II secretory pathway pseudopilin PulG